MPIELPLRQLQNALKYQFDIYEDDHLGHLPLHFSAHYQRRDERYVLSKKATVWSVENNQHFFFYEPKEATMEAFSEFVRELDAYIQTNPHHSSQHMSSIYVGFLLTEKAPSPELRQAARRCRRLSFIKWGMHGWVERYVGILLHDGSQLYAHRKGKPFVEPFLQIYQT